MRCSESERFFFLPSLLALIPGALSHSSQQYPENPVHVGSRLRISFIDKEQKYTVMRLLDSALINEQDQLYFDASWVLNLLTTKDYLLDHIVGQLASMFSDVSVEIEDPRIAVKDWVLKKLKGGDKNNTVKSFEQFAGDGGEKKFDEYCKKLGIDNIILQIHAQMVSFFTGVEIKEGQLDFSTPTIGGTDKDYEMPIIYPAPQRWDTKQAARVLWELLMTNLYLLESNCPHEQFHIHDTLFQEWLKEKEANLVTSPMTRYLEACGVSRLYSAELLGGDLYQKIWDPLHSMVHCIVLRLTFEANNFGHISVKLLAQQMMDLYDQSIHQLTVTGFARYIEVGNTPMALFLKYAENSGDDRHRQITKETVKKEMMESGLSSLQSQACEYEALFEWGSTYVNTARLLTSYKEIYTEAMSRLGLKLRSRLFCIPKKTLQSMEKTLQFNRREPTFFCKSQIQPWLAKHYPNTYFLNMACHYSRSDIGSEPKTQSALANINLRLNENNAYKAFAYGGWYKEQNTYLKKITRLRSFRKGLLKNIFETAFNPLPKEDKISRINWLFYSRHTRELVQAGISHSSTLTSRDDSCSNKKCTDTTLTLDAIDLAASPRFTGIS